MAASCQLPESPGMLPVFSGDKQLPFNPLGFREDSPLRKFALALVLLLAGCASAPPISENGSTPEAAVDLSVQKALEIYSARALLFEVGTPRGEVRRELASQQIDVLAQDADYIIVRGKFTTGSLPGEALENYYYGFTDDNLAMGPLSFAQLVDKFDDTGLTAEKIEVLKAFASEKSGTSDQKNEFARLLATHPDAEVRDPKMAITFAEQAIDETEVPDWEYYDTLAAAYAASHDFDKAVSYQRKALGLNSGTDESAERRLRLYENGEAYVAAAGELQFQSDPPEFAGDLPRAGLLEEAASGSSEAQWTLAVFYIQNGIHEAGGLAAPGVYWLKQAAENGHPYAANEVGLCMSVRACGADVDLLEAAVWFARGVKSDDPYAALNLGRAYAYSRGVPHDDEEATRLLTIAADNGLDLAAFEVSFRYRDGIGTVPSQAMQQKYLRQADLGNVSPANFLLEDEYFPDLHNSRLIAAAIERWNVPPEGLAAALLSLADNIATSSQNGSVDFEIQMSDTLVASFPADAAPSLIFHLVRISASLGSQLAQRLLAVFYTGGYSVDPSPSQALYWSGRAIRSHQRVVE